MRILVPVDGSMAAHRAVRHAISIARGRTDTKIVLLNVQNRRTLELSDIDADQSADTEAMLGQRASQKVFQREIRACKDAGVGFETRAELGQIAKVIARVSSDVGADQIVMGTRGLGAIGGLLLGSVATETIHLAAVPVTLVK